MLENITGGYKTKAIVTDKTLVLTFPDAQNPSVWRMDLEKAAQASFELNSDEADNIFQLVQKNEKGTKKIIASYDSRPKAMRALMQASQALERGAKKHGKKSFGWGKLLLFIFILLTGYGLYYNASQNTLQQPAQLLPKATVTTPPTENRPLIETRDGYPVDADVFLDIMDKEQ